MADCEFDKLFTRNVPHVLERIFFSLDYVSLTACRDVCKAWSELHSSKSYQQKREELLVELLEKRSGVYLDKSVVYFPITNSGEISIAKVEVKNRTERSVRLRCSRLWDPFVHYMQGSFVVKPRSYIKIPVKYCPISGGEHSTTLEFIEEGKDSVLLKATLKGIGAGVYLDKSVVSFPNTKSEESSSAKVEVKNRTERSVRLVCSRLRGPFTADSAAFLMNPGTYIKIPVRYHPVNGGEHITTLKLIEEGKDGVMLKATLKGRCV